MFDNKLIFLFKSETFESALVELKNNLKKENQVEYYDNIYTKFVEDNPQILNSIFDERTIVKGLNRIVILAVFGAHYRQLLYPKIIFSNPAIIDETLSLILSSEDIIEDNITIAKFKKYIAKILRVISKGHKTNLLDKTYTPDEEQFTIPYYDLPHKGMEITKNSDSRLIYENKNKLQNLNKAFLPYIIIGNRAAIINLTELAGFMFESEKIFKIVIIANLHRTPYSAHNGIHCDPYSFYMHDLLHGGEIVKNVNILKDEFILYSELYTECSKYKNSFSHRYISYICWAIFHEGFGLKNDMVIISFDDMIFKFKEYNTLRWLSEEDLKWIVRYILKADDITPEYYNEIFSSIKKYYDDRYSLYDDLSFDEYEEDELKIPFYYDMRMIFSILSDKFMNELLHRI